MGSENKVKKQISNEDLIKEVLELKNELGRVPTLKEYDQKYHHRGMINSRFGTWNKFLKSIGLEAIQRYYEGEICNVKGCKNKARSRGMCRRHYNQLLSFNKVYERTLFDKNEIVEKNNYAEIVTYNEKNIVKGNVLIDNKHIEKIKSYKIHIDSDGYATVSIGREKIHLTEFLFGRLEGNKIYSYKNKNTLDCREENILIVDRSELSKRSRIQKRNKTGVKGVHKNKRTGKYQVGIGHNGQYYHLGTFDTLRDAKQARIDGEKKYWGKIYTKLEKEE